MFLCNSPWLQKPVRLHGDDLRRKTERINIEDFVISQHNEKCVTTVNWAG